MVYNELGAGIVSWRLALCSAHHLSGYAGWHNGHITSRSFPTLTILAPFIDFLKEVCYDGRKGRENIMIEKWERREAKEGTRRKFRSDNRDSVRLLYKFSIEGKAGKMKRGKRVKV